MNRLHFLMRRKNKLVLLRENNEINDKVIKWFHSKWKIPEIEYKKSIEECQKKKVEIPQWYVMMDKEEIIAGMGVIENDFHNRKDLTPNVCAVYVEENYRKQGIAKFLLNYVCEDIKKMGYPTAYLITTHTDFYEKCGWEFYCTAIEDSQKEVKVYRHVSEI